MKVDPGTAILMEGSKAPPPYTALRGVGSRFKLLADGKRQVINFILPGDFIGLQAGVMGEMWQSVEASIKMTLCVFDGAHPWTLFKQQPDRAFDLPWLAAVQEHVLGAALTSMGQMDAKPRIAWGLSRFFAKCENLRLFVREQSPFRFASGIWPMRWVRRRCTPTKHAWRCANVRSGQSKTGPCRSWIAARSRTWRCRPFRTGHVVR